MEYKYGRSAPKNLALVLVGGQIAVWLAVMLAYAPLLLLIDLDRAAILHGQVWRLVTFVFSPFTFDTNPLWFALGLYLVYMIGTSLERAWGSFHFDVYLAMGVAGAWLACLVTGYGSNMGIYYSLFFAFAFLFPDTQLLLFFVLPVKVKWLGWLSGALYAWQVLLALLSFQWLSALGLVIQLLPFLVFFGPGSVRWVKTTVEAKKRRREWQNQWRDR